MLNSFIYSAHSTVNLWAGIGERRGIMKIRITIDIEVNDGEALGGFDDTAQVEHWIKDVVRGTGIADVNDVDAREIYE